LGCEDRAFEGDLWWRECDVCGTKMCGECAGGKEWGCERCDKSTCSNCAPPASCSVCHAEGVARCGNVNCAAHTNHACAACAAPLCEVCAERCVHCGELGGRPAIAYCPDCTPPKRLATGPRCGEPAVRHEALARLALPRPRRCAACDDLYCDDCYLYEVSQCSMCDQEVCQNCLEGYISARRDISARPHPERPHPPSGCAGEGRLRSLRSGCGLGGWRTLPGGGDAYVLLEADWNWCPRCEKGQCAACFPAEEGRGEREQGECREVPCPTCAEAERGEREAVAA
jgi:hypothetical protein